jgi:hypothetical protein
LVLAGYVITVMRSHKYAYSILESISQSNNSTHNLNALKLVLSIFVIAGYFLLFTIAEFVRFRGSNFVVTLEYAFKRTFQIHSESKIERAYKYNLNIVLKHEVKRYLEDKPDDLRIKKIYEAHNQSIDYILDRKTNMMALSILFALNLYLNHEKTNLISVNTRLYWFIVIGLAIWSVLLPYDNLNFIYITRNHIRQS